jgi:S-adenosylmethionine-diacylglycerol 3-amino-3-carboxypropyl transferase
MRPSAWFSNLVFGAIHRRNLIYNACWEDPRLDRVALELTDDDTVVVITSAGCNALDYALAGAGAVHAVDMNPRQNALLELKLAGARSLPFDDYFSFFGEGSHPRYRELYAACLRPQLSPAARRIWDRSIGYFRGKGRRSSLYLRGTSGLFAWLANQYIDRVKGLREALNEMLDCDSLDRQRELYHERVRPAFWKNWVRWVVERDSAMCLLGVPRAQIEQIRAHYGGGLSVFIEECLDAVFGELPLRDNYFWRVYLRGCYTRECCPEYLKREGYDRLRGGAAERVHVHTSTVHGFLEEHDGMVSKFVLLDHMDWLSTHAQAVLRREWEAILGRAAPGARAIWRGAGLDTDFVDGLTVTAAGRERPLPEFLRYHHELAAELHGKDRVHTYGCFRIADLVGGQGHVGR